MDQVPVFLGGGGGLTNAGRLLKVGTADYTIEESALSESSGALTGLVSASTDSTVYAGRLGKHSSYSSISIISTWTATSQTCDDLGSVTTADINGGTIDGTTIGGTTPAAITATSLKSTTLSVTSTATLEAIDVDGGTIDGAVIGGTTPAAITGTNISGTTISTSSTAALATVDIDGGTIDGATVAGGLNVQPTAYAEIYVADNSTAQTIATGTTYTKLTGFDTDGLSNECTAVASTDQITFTRTGIYRVEFTLSGSCDTNSSVFDFSAFYAGVEQDNVHTEQKFGTAGDVDACGMSGHIDVTSTSTSVDIRARHDQASAVELTPTYMNMNVQRIGDT